MLTEDAKDTIVEIRECGFTHDFVNNEALSYGNVPLQTFNDVPEVTISGNTVYLKWTNTEGFSSTVVLYEEDVKWKINDAGFLVN